MKKLIIALTGLTALCILSLNVIQSSSATNGLAAVKLQKTLPTNSAFNDESLHAEIGGTWSGAGTVKG